MVLGTHILKNKLSVYYQGQSVSKDSQFLNIDKAVLITLNTTLEAEGRNTDQKKFKLIRNVGLWLIGSHRFNFKMQIPQV